MRSVAIILTALIICYPTNDTCDGCEPWPEWKCIAGGQEIFKVFCKRFWTILLFDDDGEPEELSYTNGYWDCTGINNSKDCVLKKMP